MTRATLTTNNRNEVVKAVVHRVTFVELKFPSGTVRSNTGDRTYTWGGFSWLADARFLEHTGVSEAADNKARQCIVRLSGADNALVNKVLNDKLSFSEVNLYEGFCDEAWVLVADPFPVATNLLMSAPRLIVESDKTTVELALEKWTIRSSRPAPALGTPHIQRARYPNDTGFDRVAYIMTQAIEWGGEYGRGGGTPMNGQMMEYRKHD